MAQKVWMITGASRGFGAEIANAVLAEGDKVIATARNEESLNHLDGHENIFKVALDVTRDPQVKKAVKAALAHFGRIDVLVNNAGFGLLGAVEEGSRKEIENIYRTNVFGLLNVTRGCCRACASSAPAILSICPRLRDSARFQGGVCMPPQNSRWKESRRRSTESWRRWVFMSLQSSPDCSERTFWIAVL
jgi:NAD(P)-dependent dehydrogenase (short-subunit alcohol dehydrogenase family)